MKFAGLLSELIFSHSFFKNNSKSHFIPERCVDEFSFEEKETSLQNSL